MLTKVLTLFEKELFKTYIMSLIDDNVIPGNHGKIFGTNANETNDLLEIKNILMELDGVVDVIVNDAIFPKEFTIHTDKLVTIKAIEEKVKSVGFHAIPKSLFEL
jgi:hypothetical protein